VWDAHQRAGSWGKVKPGTILGADGSGTIAAIGSEVAQFKVGDQVYAYSYGTARAVSMQNMSAFLRTG
jgi:NADPH:quinone reductase-like Zn-dependent oxidoreductase